MALARDTRMDRRRRVLLDASAAEQAEGGKRDKNQSGQADATGKKGAGYSQDVRQACGTRLVQLIPVRKRSFSALIIASVSVTSFLLIAHYLVYVTGQLPWYGHPLAVALDATHPQSLAAWLGSHLWLMCLGATILTFQLRRHKLDDYRGEYRLWFWLVITCLIASIDSTTHITELFGQSLDRWSKINIGWSGKAVILATLSALIGMLGLRLCTELKSVPTSLVCWLLGLACWAGSAALGQEMLRLDMAIQTRIWLRAGLWLIGLTSIWIAAVAYLRHVYIEAQQRFLARGLLARRASTVPLKERVRQKIPFLRGRRDGSEEELEEGEAPERKGWSLRRLLRRKPKSENSETESTRATKKTKSKPASATTAQPQTTQNPASQPQTAQTQATRPVDAVNRPQASAASPQASAASSARPTQQPQLQTSAQSANVSSASATSKRDTTASKASADDTEKKKRGWPLKFKFWPGKDVPEEDATEYQKLTREEKAEEQRRVADERKLEREMAKADKAKTKEILAAQRAADKQAKKYARQASTSDGQPKEGIGKKLLKPVAAVGGALKKIKLPSLSAFKLSPPDAEAEQSEVTGGNTLRPANPNGPLPGTSSKPVSGPQLAGRSNNANYQDDEDDEDDDRQMSKAERKKLRRQNRAA
ncbi:MAG: hypothetical protein U0930_14575 [Pirellulales bacterium]